ncbi:MAG: helix-turn-helix transcriptional regulator [Isosphaeraceae bacterium]
MCRGQPVRFGERVRELRKAKKLSQRALESQVGVSSTYISKVENKKLDFGDYPSEVLIQKLAAARLIAHLDVTGRKPPSSSRRRGHNSAPK